MSHRFSALAAAVSLTKRSAVFGENAVMLMAAVHRHGCGLRGSNKPRSGAPLDGSGNITAAARIRRPSLCRQRSKPAVMQSVCRR
ncbi:hypothetical protein A1356_16670 [Methylomonas koyamae]|uniref:Uncharacterized protein n=1 Tax=Methylomonas koyamae TaxID=702114 RepID=A0AA91DAY3_9GAMM|nr:hypothetical protein A1356_16670 [Methylomonas koyamae]